MPPKFDPTEVKLGKWRDIRDFLSELSRNSFMQKPTTIPWGFGYVAVLRVHKSNVPIVSPVRV